MSFPFLILLWVTVLDLTVADFPITTALGYADLAPCAQIFFSHYFAIDECQFDGVLTSSYANCLCTQRSSDISVGFAALGSISGFACSSTDPVSIAWGLQSVFANFCSLNAGAEIQVITTSTSTTASTATPPSTPSSAVAAASTTPPSRPTSGGPSRESISSAAPSNTAALPESPADSFNSTTLTTESTRNIHNENKNPGLDIANVVGTSFGSAFGFIGVILGFLTLMHMRRRRKEKKTREETYRVGQTLA